MSPAMAYGVPSGGSVTRGTMQSLASRLLLCAVVSVLWVACGSDDRVCTPGEALGCTCTNGAPGQQVCNSEGTSLKQCICDPVEPDGGPTDTGIGKPPTPLDTKIHDEDDGVLADEVTADETGEDEASYGETYDAEVGPWDGDMDAGGDGWLDSDADADAHVAEDGDADSPLDADIDALPPEDIPALTPCGTNLDCNDDNVCTNDICIVSNGLCFYDATFTDGLKCDSDGDGCTMDDKCDAGICAPGKQANCWDMGDACNAGVCVSDGPKAYHCEPTPANEGFPCDDQSVCTLSDTCQAGVCTGPPLGCNEDADPCTKAICHPDVGCDQLALADGAPCDDGQVCTTDGKCVVGQCASDPVSCEGDGDPCTLDVCQTGVGCVHLPKENGAWCDDEDVCSIDDSCQGGLCEAGGALDCTGDDPCETGACNALAGGCVYTAVVGCGVELAPCFPENDDKAPCTEGVCDPATSACVPCLTAADCPAAGLTCQDHQCMAATPCDDDEACADGVCDVGAGVCLDCLSSEDCDDGWSCVEGSCNDPAVGCETDEDCLGGWFCTDGQACRPTVCDDPTCAGLWHFDCAANGSQYIPPVLSCDDGNLCTSDFCLDAQGCVQIATDGACDDGDLCTADDACSGGSCAGTLTVFCEDGDLCNGTETCNPLTATCQDGQPVGCDDLDACNGLETCDAATGGCLDGAPVSCDDGDLCDGDETCDPVTGECLSGIPVVCDDLDPCNGVETCEAASGTCAAGTPIACDDGDPCNGLEVCDGEGICADGEAVICDDGNPCNGVETCGSETGACAAGTPVVCADEDLCDGTETCDQATGTCVEGPPLDCDDEDTCTDDYCTPEFGCSHVFKQVCNDGLCDDVTCADGLPCTSDACDPATGDCVLGPVDCDDLDPCTTDVCDGNAVEGEDPCLHVLDDPACTVCVSDEDCVDEDACTLDACDFVTGTCDLGTPNDCSDGNPCSADLCDPVAGCSWEIIKPCPGLACQFDFECDDETNCTTDTCTIAPGALTGDCSNVPLECDDGVACNIGVCDPDQGDGGKCVFSEVDCDDQDLCTLDACDALTGVCEHTAAWCDDGEDCTHDYCLPASGCAHDVITLCGASCVNAAACNDGEGCTIDACDGAVCAYGPADCDDANPCTHDSCVPGAGCVQTPMSDCGPAASE